MRLLIVALLLSCATAHAAIVALPNPPAAAITGGVQCGQPPVTAVVTGFSADGQYVLGQVSTHFTCSVGGRGAKPHAYSTCALIAWPVSSPGSFEVSYSPCATADPTLVFNFGADSAWTMGGVGQLSTP